MEVEYDEHRNIPTLSTNVGSGGFSQIIMAVAAGFS